MKAIALLVLVSLAGVAAAQSAGDGARGSTPPGSSQDGARPAEGALKGGTLAPGAGARPARRCYELDGSLREQCLADEARKASARGAAPSAGSPARRD